MRRLVFALYATSAGACARALSHSGFRYPLILARCDLHAGGESPTQLPHCMEINPRKILSCRDWISKIICRPAFVSGGSQGCRT